MADSFEIEQLSGTGCRRATSAQHSAGVPAVVDAVRREVMT